MGGESKKKHKKDKKKHRKAEKRSVDLDDDSTDERCVQSESSSSCHNNKRRRVESEAEGTSSNGNEVAVTVPLATNINISISGDAAAASAADNAVATNVAKAPDASSTVTTSSSAAGWSWGDAFAAASQIRPNDDDLDEDFLKRTAAAYSSTAKSGAGGQADEGGGGGGGLAAIAGMMDASTSPATSVGAYATAPTTGSLEDDVNQQDSDKNRKPKDKKKKSKKNKESKDKKKERKSKKRQRSSSSSFANDSSADDNDISPSPSSANLECRMIAPNPLDPTESVMVLVDKASGIVYSGSDRTENGNMIAIGKLIDDKVVLDMPPRTPIVDKDSTADSSTSFPFEVDADDHCESPLDAYEDIAPLLRKICDDKKKDATKLSVYDPYYCDGSIIRNLSSLGFSNVYNKKEDCYKVWFSPDQYPNYDVFVTNPPYSADHIERLMKHVTSPMLASRPFFLLMPTWVHKKDYYTKILDQHGIKPFYLIPKAGKRYIYLPPKQFREKKASDVHKKSSPFMSMWFVYGGNSEKNASLVDWCHRFSANAKCPWDVARSKSALRDLRRKKKGKK